MEGNDRDLLNSDLSEENKMTDSNLEDDTEDYIQPSQPLSVKTFSQSPGLDAVSKKVLKTDDFTQMSVSTIEETLPLPKHVLTPSEDENVDFIPGSENPKRRKLDSILEDNCQKSLNVNDTSFSKVTPDLFSTQSQLNDTIDAALLKLPKSPMFESGTTSSVPESPQRINETLESEISDAISSENSKPRVLEETTPSSLNNESMGIGELSVSDVEENNKAHKSSKDILQDPSVLLLDNAESSSLLHSRSIDVVNGNKSRKPLEASSDDTIDVEDIKYYCTYSSEKTDVEVINIPPITDVLTTQVDSDSEFTPGSRQLSQKILRLKSALKNISDEELSRLQKHSTPENPLSQSLKINESTSSIENGTPQGEDDMVKPNEINFTMYLQLNCQVVIDPLKNEPISKKILSVKELLKRQPKQIFLDPVSDSPYKAKRLSSSSSGSVYSDKTALPYILPGRSPASIATENSSNGSVDLVKHIKISERQFWLNEYMIPLALDEILPRYIEKNQREPRKNDGNANAKRKTLVRVRKKSHRNYPLDNVLESSMTEQSSENNSDVQIPDNSERSKPLENIESNNESQSLENHGKQEMVAAEEQEQKDEHKEEIEERETKQDNVLKEFSPKKNESKSVDGIMTEGLLVFARWTDKRYYSGKLSCKAKYDRWEVDFDDGTSKVIREDIILPLNWLTKGELVFALVGDKYASGKILDIIREEETIKFKIELDDTDEELIVEKSDICLNDVMAGIIREKFKPTNKTNVSLKPSDIDFDNVVVGKRLREQRTPIRSASVLQPGSSTKKKRKAALRSSKEMSGDKKTPKVKTPFSKTESTPDTCTKDKSLKLEMETEIGDEETGSGTSSKTSLQANEKSEGTRKRGRPLKHDPDLCATSTKKSLLKPNKTENRNIDSSNKKGKKSSKALITEFENEDSDAAGKLTTEEVDMPKPNKTVRTPKSKDENIQGKGTSYSAGKSSSTGKRRNKRT